MIKLAELPKYLLITESELETFQGQVLGRWRFSLQSPDGDFHFEAMDWEPGVSLERLELLTAVRGLEELDQRSEVTIVTDSHYVVHGFGFGLREWRVNGWTWERFGDVVTIPNQDLWRRLDRATQLHHVRCRQANIDSLNGRETIRMNRCEPPASEGRRREKGFAHGTRRWIQQLTRIASSVVPV